MNRFGRRGTFLLASIVILIIGTTQVNAVGLNECPSGMISYWSFDDPSNPGKDEFDRNNGLLDCQSCGPGCSNPNRTNDGVIGGAMNFDGVDDYIDLGNDDGLEPVGQFSICAWVKIGPEGGPNWAWRPVLIRGDWENGGRSYGLQISGPADWPPRRGFFEIFKSNTGTGHVDTVPINDEAWHFLTATYDYLAGISIYLDGALQTHLPGPVSMSSTAYHTYIGGLPGCSPWLSYYFFKGLIDEMAVFNRVLTTTEIQQMYDNGIFGNGYCSSALGSVYQEDPDGEYPEPDHPLHGFWYYVIYDKPLGAVGAKWKVKHGSYDPYDIPIPAACWNADPDHLKLRLYSNSNDGAGHAVSWPECYEDANWIQVGKKASETYGGSGEEAEPPFLMTDGDWETYNVWNEIGPSSSRWTTNHSKTAPRWYEEGVWFLIESTDSDGDGIADNLDNCPNVANPDQADSDADGTGNACDGCPADPNKTSPGVCGCGVADADSDGDGVADCNDNCPTTPNMDQVDVNDDGYGDACVSPDATIALGVELGYNPTIGSGTEIHKDTSVGDNAIIGSSVVIMKDVTIGSNVKIGDESIIGKETSIGNNVVIGSNTTIMKGVTIGDNSIIGSRVFINKNISIPAGSEIPDGTVL